MIYAQVLSPWAGDGTPLVNPKRPQFFDDYPKVTANDVTGQAAAPPPGCLVIEIFTTPAEFAVIETDPDYQVLLSEERPDDEAA